MADWEIQVTNADVRAAKDAWRAARENGASQARIDELHGGYERLVRTQGRQIAAAFRQRAHRPGSTGTPPVGGQPPVAYGTGG